jgi:hypothetical protein
VHRVVVINLQERRCYGLRTSWTRSTSVASPRAVRLHCGYVRMARRLALGAVNPCLCNAFRIAPDRLFSSNGLNRLAIGLALHMICLVC